MVSIADEIKSQHINSSNYSSNQSLNEIEEDLDDEDHEENQNNLTPKIENKLFPGMKKMLTQEDKISISETQSILSNKKFCFYKNPVDQISEFIKNQMQGFTETDRDLQESQNHIDMGEYNFARTVISKMQLAAGANKVARLRQELIDKGKRSQIQYPELMRKEIGEKDVKLDPRRAHMMNNKFNSLNPRQSEKAPIVSLNYHDHGGYQKDGESLDSSKKIVKIDTLGDISNPEFDIDGSHNEYPAQTFEDMKRDIFRQKHKESSSMIISENDLQPLNAEVKKSGFQEARNLGGSEIKNKFTYAQENLDKMNSLTKARANEGSDQKVKNEHDSSKKKTYSSGLESNMRTSGLELPDERKTSKNRSTASILDSRYNLTYHNDLNNYESDYYETMKYNDTSYFDPSSHSPDGPRTRTFKTKTSGMKEDDSRLHSSSNRNNAERSGELETIFSEKNDEMTTNALNQRNPEDRRKSAQKISNGIKFAYKDKFHKDQRVKVRTSAKKMTNAQNFFKDFNKQQNGSLGLKTILNTGKAKHAFLRLLAQNHNDLLKKPETGSLLAALQKIKNIDELKKAEQQEDGLLQNPLESKTEIQTDQKSIRNQRKSKMDNNYRPDVAKKSNINNDDRESKEMKGSIQSLANNKSMYNYIKEGISVKFAQMTRYNIQVLKHILLFVLIITTYSLRININMKVSEISSTTKTQTNLLSIEIPQAYLLGITSMKFLLDENWINRADLTSESVFEFGQIQLMRQLVSFKHILTTLAILELQKSDEKPKHLFS